MAKRRSGLTLGQLTPDPVQARVHDDQNRGQIRQSLTEVGAARSIVINGAGKIIAGQGVRDEALALGLKLQVVKGRRDTLIAVQRDDLTPDEEIRAALWDNRTGDHGKYDAATVANLQKGGHTAGIWTDQELRALQVAARGSGHRRNPDELPAKRETTIQPGDLFTLGRHRLLCGDATKREDVGRLMGDTRADLMVTDPPYGVLFGASGGKKQNAIRGDLSQAEIPVSFAVSLDHALTENARIYLCGGTTNLQTYWKLFDHYLHLMPRIIVWTKEAFLLRHNNYHSQFELVYFGWKGKGGDPSFWFGDRKQSDVWDIPRDPNYLHPTQKPAELFARAIRNSCPADGLCYEPFAGSGTAFIAAEAEGRRCVGLELDPGFAQVIIDRWEAFTGQTAQKVEP